VLHRSPSNNELVLVASTRRLSTRKSWDTRISLSVLQASDILSSRYTDATHARATPPPTNLSIAHCTHSTTTTRARALLLQLFAPPHTTTTSDHRCLALLAHCTPYTALLLTNTTPHPNCLLSQHDFFGTQPPLHVQVKTDRHSIQPAAL
jgi:hypothetical protein